MSVRNKIKRVMPVSVSSRIKMFQMLKYKGVKKPSCNTMPLYNKYGEQMHSFFLMDQNFPLEYSATAGQTPRNIFWDRARYNLPIHFYTDDLLFIKKGKPKKKFGILFEPSTLQPKKYDTILRTPSCLSEYEAVFTHDQRLLDKLPNAKPLIIGGVYIGTPFGGGTIDADSYKRKCKNVSIVSSNKLMCELHEFRYAIAKRYEHDDRVDCFGTFNGKFVKIADSLSDYRYSFAIENNIEPLWITERICNCFASMTVPIYLGSPDIGKYFNIDGIIIIEKQDLKYIDEILKSCTEEDYLRRLPALQDNFERVKQYYCVEDWIFHNYLLILILLYPH